MTEAWDCETILAELHRVEKHLDRPVEAYLIGGAALTVRGFKDETPDIDICLKTTPALDAMCTALESMGYSRTLFQKFGSDAHPMLTFEDARGSMIQLARERFGIGLMLSEGIMDRSETQHSGEYLHLKVISPEDIFLRKVIAGRNKDKQDTIPLQLGDLEVGIIRSELAVQEELLGVDLPTVVMFGE